MKAEKKQNDRSTTGAPRGTVEDGPSSAATLAVYDGPDGSGFVECPEDPADPGACAGCGGAVCDCDSEFCCCTDPCLHDGEEFDDFFGYGYSIDLCLEQFMFDIRPDDLMPGDYHDCWHPDYFTAFWDKDELVVADPNTDTRYRVICCVAQIRASSQQYYTWYCERIMANDPCDDDFMRSISS